MYFRRVDQTADVGVVDDIRGKKEVFLECRGSSGRAIDLIQRSEGRGSPDDEAAKMTTRGELQEVEREDGGSLDPRDVSKSTNELLAIFIWVVDDQWTSSLAVTTTSKLSLSGTEFARSSDLVKVWACTDCLE